MPIYDWCMLISEHWWMNAFDGCLLTLLLINDVLPHETTRRLGVPLIMISTTTTLATRKSQLLPTSTSDVKWYWRASFHPRKPASQPVKPSQPTRASGLQPSSASPDWNQPSSQALHWSRSSQVPDWDPLCPSLDRCPSLGLPPFLGLLHWLGLEQAFGLGQKRKNLAWSPASKLAIHHW